MERPLTYAEKCRVIAYVFERNERENGRDYALRELRTMLNHTSNEALAEMQATRDRPINLLETARTDWQNGERA